MSLQSAAGEDRDVFPPPDIPSALNANLSSPTHHWNMQLPSPIITKRTRTKSVSERALEGPVHTGTVKFFCRERGHGFITMNGSEDDYFVHISDIDGEFVPHAGDTVQFRLTACPPKMDRFQAGSARRGDQKPGTGPPRAVGSTAQPASAPTPGAAPAPREDSAVHVVIKNLAPGRHERWDQPPSPHWHPHPEPHLHLEMTGLAD